ncbi:unnamed protein product [Paramecium primaurelia]|uniref:VPS9 domain-containing protein n=1 Tax=Paramecium primaurelia TaxID=5886 RepID=A0A8S1MCA6_PARPR|nr:unnamed protein product [Paramecium primaurelia]
MGNKNICCCTQEEQQQQSQTLGSELKLFLSFSWHAQVNEIINRNYNHMPLLNEYRVSHTLQTIQQRFHIRNQMLSDIFYSFVQNPKEMKFHSLMKISFVSTSIIISDNSYQSQLAQSFMKATDCQILQSLSSSPLDLKMEINLFKYFFVDLILKFYKSIIKIDEIKMLILDELFGNQIFMTLSNYNMTKDYIFKCILNVDQTIVIAYQKNIKKQIRSQNKQEKAVAILQSIITKRSPSEKLIVLNKATQQLTSQSKIINDDKFNELVNDLIVHANIPSFITEIKMIHHFAGEIDCLGRYGYVLTGVMGLLMLIIQDQ